MCSPTLPPVKEKRREGAPSIRFSFVGGRVTLQVSYKNCFELFLSAHFLIWEIINVNLTFPFAVNVMLKLSNKRKGYGEGRETGEVSPLALPHQPLQRLHHKCFFHWAAKTLPRCKRAGENCCGRRKGELQSHEKRHRCGSFLLIQYLIYSIKHRGAYLIFNVSDAVFIRGRLVVQNHIS